MPRLAGVDNDPGLGRLTHGLRAGHAAVRTAKTKIDAVGGSSGSLLAPGVGGGIYIMTAGDHKGTKRVSKA